MSRNRVQDIKQSPESGKVFLDFRPTLWHKNAYWANVAMQDV
jgi:hypothetical protein